MLAFFGERLWIVAGCSWSVADDGGGEKEEGELVEIF